MNITLALPAHQHGKTEMTLGLPDGMLEWGLWDKINLWACEEVAKMKKIDCS